ncbi:MAG TPA: response regulator transcription factor [Drouetiella sp.]
MPKLLLADDDKQLRQIVGDWLEHEHYIVDLACDGLEAKEYLLSGGYDLLILDWSMPQLTGIEVCKWFRARGGSTPILMLTGKDEIEHKETGFGAGVDDYLTKPFELRELTARLRALLRRVSVASSSTIKVGPLVLDPDTHGASVDGKSLTLTGTEFAVLEFLGRHPNQVFNANALLDRVWNNSAEVSPDTVRVYIKRLRAKFDALGHSDLIQNVHGVGYKLMA